ncbi:MAG: ABC transporter permease [Acholeplasmataceae bacterium]|nr:ABC transporter permease [Acholeplasmataceae bacterium]
MTNYLKAKLEDYGYKDYSQLNKIYKVVSWIIVGIVVIMLYLSIITIALQSFNTSSDITSFESFTLKWYTEIFSHRQLRNSIINTFLVSIIATTLATILGTLIAVGIHSLEPKKRNKIMLLNNIPLLNADIVTGISLMLIFSILLPLFPYIFGPMTLIIAHLFFTLPYVIISVLPKLREIDPFIMEAALDLGVRPFKALRKIIIPAIEAGIFSGMLLAFTMSLDDFVISYYTTGNGFDNLSIWVYGSIGRRSLTPAVYAYSTLLTIVTLGLVLTKNFMSKKRGLKHEAK